MNVVFLEERREFFLITGQKRRARDHDMDSLESCQLNRNHCEQSYDVGLAEARLELPDEAQLVIRDC